jgi:hypothetical protein
VWCSATLQSTGPCAFSGTLYRNTDPPFSAVSFLPAQVHGVPVGTVAVSFTYGNTGAFAYVVHDGINAATQTKPITREVFRAPGTVCQ